MKATTISLIIGGLLLAGALSYAFVARGNGSGSENVQSGSVPSRDNVSMIGEKQVIDLTAKGGYSPRKTLAKAGVPTILRVNTTGTFDCSSIIRIPSLDISENLPRSGSVEIALGTPEPGVLDGSCGMGMYPFEVIFES